MIHSYSHWLRTPSKGIQLYKIDRQVQIFKTLAVTRQYLLMPTFSGLKEAFLSYVLRHLASLVTPVHLYQALLRLKPSNEVITNA